LEFFEFIRRENVKVLVNHLVENYREKIKDITYVDTFSNLILRFDQSQGYSTNMDTSFLDTEEDTPGRSQVSGGRRWQGAKDLDAAEEEYFNTSDDEEDTPGKSSSARASVNGASPLTKPLVDYGSDEENEMMDSELSAGIVADKDVDIEAGKSKGKAKDEAGEESSAPTPPERLSEKRRREEDEEDELGKLAQQQPKRRNSNTSTSSTASSPSSSLRRRKSSIARDPGGSSGRKIAIQFSPAIKSGGEGSDSGGDTS